MPILVNLVTLSDCSILLPMDSREVSSSCAGEDLEPNAGCVCSSCSLDDVSVAPRSLDLLFRESIFALVALVVNYADTTRITVEIDHQFARW